MSTLHTNSKVRKAETAEPCFFPQFVFTPGLAPGQVNAQLVPMSGIPMRDYFAAKAMMSLSGFDDSWENFPGIARDAYRLADAMLKAREPEVNNSQFHGDHMTTAFKDIPSKDEYKGMSDES